MSGLQQQLTDDELKLTWSEFLSTHSRESRHRLMLHYIWLVRYVVNGLHIPSHSILSEQDFISFGIVGLNEALDRFEAERGLKFETFAMPRVKGMILDELRRLDWLSRSARKRVQEYLAAADALRSQEGREVTSEEIRQKLNVTQDEYQSYLSATAASISALSLYNGVPTQSVDEEESVPKEIEDPDWNDVLQSLQDEEQQEFIVRYLEKLPEKKRLVMSLYYYEELTFKEIGLHLNVTESRVCQIHTQTINDLRKKLRDYDHA
jgi:RNA polymerase sigma factor for flagellar operon FliA